MPLNCIQYLINTLNTIVQKLRHKTIHFFKSRVSYLGMSGFYRVEDRCVGGSGLSCQEARVVEVSLNIYI